MGREVRRVPAGWEHPKDDRGRYKPMHGRPYKEKADMWKRGFLEWESRGAEWQKASKYYAEVGKPMPTDYWGWAGNPPNEKYYMPDWPESERTHYQMYEDTSEGTPISPVMDSPEKLARWLADNGASAFGSMTATYEQWLAMMGGRGCSVGLVIKGDGRMMSGVEALGELPLGAPDA